jgi:hypothetical protein
MPVDANGEEATGNYGESLADSTPRRPSRYKLWLVVLFMLLILSASGLGIGFWVKKLDHATTSSEGDGGPAALSTFVNVMPAHPTVV